MKRSAAEAVVRNASENWHSSYSRGSGRLKEKLQVYALWAEILGGIAILVSLLFVGIQLRQSNALATTDALKEGTEMWTETYAERSMNSAFGVS